MTKRKMLDRVHNTPFAIIIKNNLNAIEILLFFFFEFCGGQSRIIVNMRRGARYIINMGWAMAPVL